MRRRVWIMDLSYHIIKNLHEERQFLKEMLDKLMEEINKAPEGKVLLKKNRQSVQFYHRMQSWEKCGTYIPVSEKAKAIRLIQKQYYEHLCDEIKKQLDVIDEFLAGYGRTELKNVFASEGKLRQRYITPIISADEEYATAWQALEYEHKPFSEGLQEHYTQKNERVRSKSEAMIADSLNLSGIPYRYECPIKVHAQIYHPDFTILRMYDRKVIYWEHLGLIDKEDYMTDAISRIREYESIGIFLGDNLIITAETAKIPLNSKVIHQKIQHYLLPPEI